MASIHFADDIYCGIWLAHDCSRDGLLSYAEIHESAWDIHGQRLLRGTARSYRCIREGTEPTGGDVDRRAEFTEDV